MAKQTSATYDPIYGALPDGDYIQVRITAYPIPATYNKEHDSTGVMYPACSGMTVDFHIEVFELSAPHQGTLMYDGHLDATTAVFIDNNGVLQAGQISVNPANPDDPTHYNISGWSFTTQGILLHIAGFCSVRTFTQGDGTVEQMVLCEVTSVFSEDGTNYCGTVDNLLFQHFILITP